MLLKSTDVIELKRLIQQWRESKSDQAPLDDNMDISKRYSRIIKCESRVLYLILRQWLDILLLYENCADQYPQSSAHFAIDVSKHSSCSPNKTRGNPVNIAKSDITDHILRQLFPDLEPFSCTWKLERRRIKNLCQFGSRLVSLKSRRWDFV